MSLTVSNLTFGYKQNKIIHDLNFQTKAGDVVSLVGPNGSGKTTLLKCIAHIHKAWTGNVTVNGIKLDKLDSKELAKIVGYVPQDTGSSFPISVFNAVLLGRTPYVRFNAADTDIDVVTDCLCLMGLSELSFRMMNELSGGERQRVFIARALAQEPQVLLLDEPTSNLDLKHQLETLRIVRNIAIKRGLIVVMAIHDLNLASRFSDRIVMLKKGIIFAQGSSADVINSENIQLVYDVSALVHIENGKPFVMPLEVQSNEEH
jgi:iron complex transport system ATP-binding protein